MPTPIFRCWPRRTGFARRKRNIASATRILEAIKQRYKAGTGTDLDVAQQESVLANQKALVPPLRQTLEQNINALATLVSRPPESVKVTGGSLNQIASPRVTPGLPSELLTQRPDIRRQEAQLASATANVGNARAQFFPSIQLTGQGGYQSSALSSLFQPHAAFFSMVGSLTQPIFDGGRILGNFELTKAKQDELLQTYRKTVVQSFADVDNALVAIRQTTDQVRLQREVLAASRRAFELSEQQLRAGTADIVTVLNTQLTLFQAEDTLWQAQLGPAARDRQPLSGAGGRLGAEDGKAGRCSLSRTRKTTRKPRVSAWCEALRRRIVSLTITLADPRWPRLYRLVCVSAETGERGAQRARRAARPSGAGAGGYAPHRRMCRFISTASARFAR